MLRRRFWPHWRDPLPCTSRYSALLKGQDSVAYTTAMYRLGFAYAKLSKTTEAMTVLTEAAAIPGLLQQTRRDLLAK